MTDFWGAYNAVACACAQTCLVHLLRDLKQVEKYKVRRPTTGRRLPSNCGDSWATRSGFGDCVGNCPAESTPRDEHG